MTNDISDILFAPSDTAVENLKREGITSWVFKVGDVMFDVALFFGDKAKRESDILKDLNFESKIYILATVHRAENTDNPTRLMEIFEGLDEVARDIPVILPLHPRTRKKLGDIKFSASNLKLISPLGYLDMVMLEKNARLIV